MGKKSAPPPPPDYRAQAEATAKSSQQAQTQADWANRPDQTDMYGNKTSWSTQAVVDPATGQTINKWSQSTQLSPDQQAAVDSEMAISKGLMGTAQGMLGRANEAVSKDFDWGNLQAMGKVPQSGQLQGAGQGLMSGLNTASLGSMPTADDQGRQRIENAMFDRMRPEHQQAQAGLEAKLANMGLTRGSEQWNREAQRLGDQQSRERYNALEAGGVEQQRQFGMQMQGREQGWNELMGAGTFQNQAQAQGFNQNAAQTQQNFGQDLQAANYQNQLRQQQIAEQQMARQMPLNELNAFMSGQQVGAPQFGNFNTSQAAGAVDYTGAAKDQYGASMDAYNAKQKQQAGLMSGIGSIAGAGIMAF
jgi:hypothetical protein